MKWAPLAPGGTPIQLRGGEGGAGLLKGSITIGLVSLSGQDPWQPPMAAPSPQTMQASKASLALTSM